MKQDTPFVTRRFPGLAIQAVLVVAVVGWSSSKLAEVPTMADSLWGVISYGKEKPAAIGYDESAWSKHRAADMADQAR